MNIEKISRFRQKRMVNTLIRLTKYLFIGASLYVD